MRPAQSQGLTLCPFQIQAKGNEAVPADGETKAHNPWMHETGATSQSDALPALKTAHPTLYPHPHIFHLPGQAPHVDPWR